MKFQPKGETLEQKKTELAKWLLKHKDAWPVMERQRWCVENGYNSDSIRKLYFMGEINSKPVAESLVEAIEDYMKANKQAA